MLPFYMLYIHFIRDIDDAVIRLLPQAKKMLSEPTALPHLVQLLLTFDPSLVDKVVTLLNNNTVWQENFKAKNLHKFCEQMTVLEIIICIMAGCGWKPVFYTSRSLPANCKI